MENPRASFEVREETGDGSTVADVARMSSLTEEQVRGYLTFCGFGPEEVNRETFHVSGGVRAALLNTVVTAQADEFVPSEKRDGWFVDHASLGGNPPLSPAECLATGRSEHVFRCLRVLRKRREESK